MKTLTLIATLCFTANCRSSHKVHILRQITDERGLTSVQYVQDGHEYAQDYLTKTEYLNLINQ